MSDERWPYEVVAENLEEFGTSRANFNHLSGEERIAVGKRVTILCNRHKVGGPIIGNEKAIFYHLCGEVGIDFFESHTIWHNAYHGVVTLEELK